MPDFAGNTPKSAYNVGTLSSPSVYTYTDWVGGIDPDDYYKFTLSGTNFFRASLSGMTGDANVSLYDANDVLIINSRNAGATPEALDIPIVAGDYYIRVTPASLVGDDSFYSLSLDAVSLFDGAGATFSTARNLSSSSVPIIYDDWVGLVDPIDLYKVTLSSNSSLQAAAYGMTGGISLKVLDKSGNIIPEFNTFTVDKFDVNLTAGTYYVEVSVAPTNPLYGTKYSLSLFNTEIRGGSQSIDGAGRYNDPAAGDKSRKIILSSVPQVINDWVGKKIDDYDDYSFTLNNPTNFLRLALNGMSGSSLIQIIDRNGTTIDTQQTNSGRPFSLERILLAGKYVLRITPAGSSDNDSTSYSLNISSSDVLDQAGRYDDPTGNLSKSLVLSDIPKIVNDRIIKVYESIDDYDDYSFTLKDSTNLFRAFLTGRSGATNMFLLNEKGDSCGDIYSSGFAGDYPPLFLERALGAGKYILRITSDSIATQTSYFNNTEYSLSLSSSVIPDQAGRYDDLAGDRSKVLILTSTPQTINDWVGTSGYSETIINDYDDYSFTITDSTKLFQLALKGLSYNPKITLMTDKGIIIENRLSSFSAAGTVLERSLSAGRYILRIKPDFSTTKYRLTLSAPLLSDKASEYNDLAGSESATAKLITIGASPIRLSDWLGKADPVDFYKFELKETSFFQAALYRLTGNLDFAILDKDGKIIVDANQKQIGYSTGPNQSLESTYLPLFKGTYYLKVYSYTTDQKTFDNSFYDLVIASTPISDLVESNTAILITPIGQFRAEYFNTTDPNIGTPVLVRNEASIDYTWGIGAPALGVNADNFSVRWTGRFNFEQGSYLFRDRADDGIRLWVDGQLVINQWKDQGPTDFGVYREMTAGEHQIKVEYYDRGAEATAKVWWQKSAPWTVNYFNKSKLPSDAQVTSSETIDTPRLDFSKNWGLGAPTNTPVDGFSAKFSTTRWLSAGLYKIQTQADDGVKVTIGGQQVIDRWSENGYFQNTGFFRSSGADVPILVEYYENQGAASLSFNISPVEKFADTVPTSTNWNATVFTWDVSKGDRPPVDFFNGDFNNPNVIGITDLGSNVRPDGKPGFLADWGSGALKGDGARLPNDYFAVRAYTTAQFDGGEYVFRAKADDGFQLFAKNKATGQWFYITPQASWEASSTIYKEYTYTLPQGSYDLHYHFYEKTGNASFDLNWGKSTRVSVSAGTDGAEMRNGKQSPGTFIISRTGNLNQAVEVEYTLSGTAKRGIDYDINPNVQNGIGKVTILAGQSRVEIAINIIDDIVAELEETIEMTIKPNNSYQISITPSVNTIRIQDNEHETRVINYSNPIKADDKVKSLIGTEEALNQFMTDDPDTEDIDESKLQFNKKYSLKTWELDSRSRTISYSFYNRNARIYDVTPPSAIGVYSELSSDIQAKVKEIFDMISTIINVKFEKVDDTLDSWGTLRYYGFVNPKTIDPKTNKPYPDNYAGTVIPELKVEKKDENILGDIYLNPNHPDMKNVSIGTYGYLTLIHETLHALGLKHPGNYNGDNVGAELGPFLPPFEDNLDNSVMTYNKIADGGMYPRTPMPYDIKTLCYLYGKKESNIASVVLNLDSLRESLWNCKAVDLSQLSGSFDVKYRIDLRMGGILSTQSNYNTAIYKDLLTKTNYKFTRYGVSIAYDTLVEHLVTSSRDDEIFANQASNTFSGYFRGQSFGNDIYWDTDSSDILDLSTYSLSDVSIKVTGADLVLDLYRNPLDLFGNHSITIKNYVNSVGKMRIKIGNSHYRYLNGKWNLAPQA